MNCWHCGTELIWGGDHDTEDNEDYDIVSNLSCPKCHAAVDVWHPSEKLIKEYKDHELRAWKHKFLKRLDMYHDLMFDEKEKAKVDIKEEDFNDKKG